jgi:hypothetical protein
MLKMAVRWSSGSERNRVWPGEGRETVRNFILYCFFRNYAIVKVICPHEY